MAEKSRIVQDESFRDLNNLERKLQKHEAFERELRANEGRLRSINKVCYFPNPSVGYRKMWTVLEIFDSRISWIFELKVIVEMSLSYSDYIL